MVDRAPRKGGRPNEGWKLHYRKGRPPTVRFTFEGREYDLGVGTRDPVEAAATAARIYAETVSGTVPRKRKQPVAQAGKSFAEAGAEWLATTAGTLRENTRAGYLGYIDTLDKFFGTLSACVPERMRAYIAGRLAVVQANTVRKELSVLRQVLAHAKDQGWIAFTPEVPVIPRKTRGTRYALRRRTAADPLSPDEMEALLAALPEWSGSRRVKRFPVRARFILGYDLALRPELLDVLRVGVHWMPGYDSIWVPADSDKTSNERWLLMTDRARAALEAIAPKSGLIFGAHDYREQLRKAARVALDPARAARFCGQHLRSAGLTHMAERGPLPGVQWIAGHTRISTTARYIKPSARAGAEVIAAMNSARVSGSDRVAPETLECEERESNPQGSNPTRT